MRAGTVALCAGLLGAGLLVPACSSPKTPSPSSKTPASSSSASSAAAAPAAPAASEFWGEMKPVVSVKELMRDMIDPASDDIFDAVKTETTKSGTVDKVPTTDADWERIRVGAVTLAEGVYLLKVPRPFAPPGDENNSVGPEATELSPAQILAKLQRDPVLWNAKIEALRNVGLEVLDIVKTKKTAELWDASYNLDQACESCHLQYWYPGDKALLEKVDRQLKELYEQAPPAGGSAPRPGR